MAVLNAASDLALVPTTPPERMNQLTEKLNGQFAVDLVHPLRLVFNQITSRFHVKMMVE